MQHLQLHQELRPLDVALERANRLAQPIIDKNADNPFSPSKNCACRGGVTHIRSWGRAMVSGPESSSRQRLNSPMLR